MLILDGPLIPSPFSIKIPNKPINFLASKMAPTNCIQSLGQNFLRQNQVVVVMVPFPAQGHLNQLLQLSRLISSYDIPVHYVGTAAHNRQAKLRVHGWDPLSTSNIHFHEFLTPTFLNPQPDPNASIKFPAHLQPSFDASGGLRGPVASLICTLSANNRRVVIINDAMMGSVIQDFVCFSNAEAYTFHSVSAFMIFFFRWEKMGKPFPVDEEILKVLPAGDGCFTPEFTQFASNQHDYAKYTSGRIYNSCKVIESPFLDLLPKLQEFGGNEKQWALGPFNPVSVQNQKAVASQRHKCLEWLDKQCPNEVIFVSFGTTTSFSDKQICELAIGLEKSEQKFIWVLRDADKGDVFVQHRERSMELPKEFEERVERKGMGYVVRNWAPQLEILEHVSTGGFISHCGWNSCMESLTIGVPMATWPIHSDQPRNAVLITQVLKVGVVVKDWAHDKDDQLVTSSAVERAVRMLMAEEAGRELRERAAKVGEAVRRSVAEGGATKIEFDSFIAHITR